MRPHSMGAVPMQTQGHRLPGNLQFAARLRSALWADPRVDGHAAQVVTARSTCVRRLQPRPPDQTVRVEEIPNRAEQARPQWHDNVMMARLRGPRSRRDVVRPPRSVNAEPIPDRPSESPPRPLTREVHKMRIPSEQERGGAHRGPILNARGSDIPDAGVELGSSIERRKRKERYDYGGAAASECGSVAGHVAPWHRPKRLRLITEPGPCETSRRVWRRGFGGAAC